MEYVEKTHLMVDSDQAKFHCLLTDQGQVILAMLADSAVMERSEVQVLIDWLTEAIG